MAADLELVVDGRPVRFPAVWLRDNCPCPDCLAPGTGQKLNDITDIPNGLAITRTEDAGESVLVTFAPISTGPRSRVPGSKPTRSATTRTATAGPRTTRNSGSPRIWPSSPP